jgi:dihydropteroate synthase
VEVAITTTRARVAAIAADHGVGTIIDPSGATADPDMARALAELGIAIVIGPWGHPGSAGLPELSGEEIEDRYAEGIVRNVAALLDAGVRSERLRIHAGAGLAATDGERWRMLNHLGRLAGLGYPVLVPATDEVLAAMVVDESEGALDDVATALTLLAIGSGSWAIRAHRVGRVEAAMQRILDRPGERRSR